MDRCLLACLLASQKEQDRLSCYQNVKVMTCTEVVDIHTRDEQDCVTLKNAKNGETKVIDVCGIFVYIGQKPKRDLFKGVFVGGDVRQKKIRQLTIATNDGTIATLSAASTSGQHNTLI